MLSWCCFLCGEDKLSVSIVPILFHRQMHYGNVDRSAFFYCVCVSCINMYFLLNLSYLVEKFYDYIYKIRQLLLLKKGIILMICLIIT